MGLGSVFVIVLVLIFVVKWIRAVKENTDRQIEQNEEIIALLKELNSNPRK
ncbi:hypothetical protein [Pseudalkalibacillus berkeleyi]|uniref:DUF4083 domain-containing protein n=1 Tax=Pseudalkalibacillus berkeleyi TaxID=1069813 RepID=A0ABS9GZV7_9BACL|nr:hypothetical protein [Pseudalkalibacillus berkeleyi]MCF6138283.1 hypothetical protein [Pseudalkalibacillus berkeleyi]